LLEDWETAKDQEPRIAPLEKIAIRPGSLRLERLGIKKGKTFFVWTDNTTTKGAIRKRKSKNREVNQEWKTIQHLLVRLEADLIAKQVTSKEKKADTLSTGERE
jgi:hypothetical protein